MKLRRTLLIYFALVTGAIVLLLPLWWMASISLLSEADARAAMSSGSASSLLPRDPHWSNYPQALQSMGAASAAELDPAAAADIATETASARAWNGFLDALANSVVITTLCVLGNVLSCSMVGYALARLRFRGRHTLFLLTIATMMLPSQVTMVPLFLLFRSLGWIDSILPLVVPSFFGSAFFIFMFRQFFSQVPEDLIEAARLDGASNLGIWWRIMLPICRPVAAITAIFTFIWTWNDFMNPLIYLQSPDKFTLALALNTFKSQFGGINKAHLLMAASIVAMLPCIILFFSAQRAFVQGLSSGAVKG